MALLKENVTEEVEEVYTDVKVLGMQMANHPQVTNCNGLPDPKIAMRSFYDKSCSWCYTQLNFQ